MLFIYLFFPLLGTKTPKCLESPPYDEKLKRMQKHPLWKNRVTLPKTTIFSVFRFVTYKNAKMHPRYRIWENDNTLRKTCIMGVFELLTY